MYDLKEIKSIPCEEVARNLGVYLKQKGNNFWFKMRPEEKTASCRINADKNLWYDFGAGKGGSVIDLVMEFKGVSKEEAINELAEEYGFAKEIKVGWRPLTDQQYREIGIQPEKATMNFGFDLDKHSVEQLERWSNKYNMHVKDLAEKYPSVYNKMVLKIAMDGINVLKDAYEARLESFRDLSVDPNTRAFLKVMSEDDAIDLNRRLELLQRALKGTNQKFVDLKVNFEKDFDEQALVKKEFKTLTEDAKIKDRIVKVYKKLFNANFEHFSVEQAKALQEINKTMVNGENKYIPLDGIAKTHQLVGQKLESLERQYSTLLREGELIPKDSVNERKNWEARFEVVEKDILRIKDLFEKCEIVSDGLREINLNAMHEKAKKNAMDNPKLNSMELSS